MENCLCCESFFFLSFLLEKGNSNANECLKAIGKIESTRTSPISHKCFRHIDIHMRAFIWLICEIFSVIYRSFNKSVWFYAYAMRPTLPTLWISPLIMKIKVEKRSLVMRWMFMLQIHFDIRNRAISDRRYRYDERQKLQRIYILIRCQFSITNTRSRSHIQL